MSDREHHKYNITDFPSVREQWWLKNGLSLFHNQIEKTADPFCR